MNIFLMPVKTSFLIKFFATTITGKLNALMNYKVVFFQITSIFKSLSAFFAYVRFLL